MRLGEGVRPSGEAHAALAADVAPLGSLEGVLAWVARGRGRRAELVAHDACARDLVIELGWLGLVFALDPRGLVLQVTVWPYRPRPSELLVARLRAGWRSTATFVGGRVRIEGTAGCRSWCAQR